MSRLHAFLKGCGFGLSAIIIIVVVVVSVFYGFTFAVDLVDTLFRNKILSVLAVLGLIVILLSGILNAADNHDR